MKEDNILDHNKSESSGKLLYNFQLAEFVLTGLFALTIVLSTFFDVTRFPEIITVLCFSIILFQLIRIYFEYNNKLITGFGIILKLFLTMNASSICTGALFKILKYPYAIEFTIIALGSLIIPFYAIYALALSNVSRRVKIIMVINSLGISPLLMGVLFFIESLPYAQGLYLVGFVLTVISLLSFSFLIKIELTNKERYHAVNYFARTVMLLILVFFI